MVVLTTGEALACFAPRPGLGPDLHLFEKSFGGAEFNTAIGLARLNEPVRWFSRVGADDFGDELLQIATAAGIDVTQVQRSEKRPTSIMVKNRTTPSIVRVSYYRSNSPTMELGEPDARSNRLFADVDHLHFSGISLWANEGLSAFAMAVAQEARIRGVRISFDPNFRPALSTVDKMVSRSRDVASIATEFLCNEKEAEEITGERDPELAAMAISRLGPTAVVVKRGEHGAIARVDGRSIYQQAWPVAEIVDTVGAGDAFNAGWIHGRRLGVPPQQALALGSYVAAQVVGHSDDFEGFPTRKAVDEWIASQDALTSKVTP